MKPSRACQAGQVFVEFVLCLVIAVLAVVAAARVFQAHWRRSQCAYFLFERTHASLVGGSSFNSRFDVKILDLDDRVLGILQCEEEIQRVEFPKLEAVKW